MSDQFDAILAALSRLEHGQTSLQTQIGAVRTDLQAEIGAVQTELRMVRTDLQAEIGAVQTELRMVRTDLQAEIGVARTDLQVEISAVRTDLQVEISAVRTDLQAEIITTRTQIMTRLDRQQERLESMFNDIAVNWYSVERTEQKVESDREEIRLLAGMVNTLTRMVRTMESRLAIVEGKL